MPDTKPRTAGDLLANAPIARRSLVGGLGLAIASTCLALSGCSNPFAPARPYSSSTFAFDTYCTFTTYGDDGAPAKLARACARYDALFDLYDPQSDIARINASNGAPTGVDPETADVIKRAISFSDKLDGLFDITIGSVSTLWNFDEGVRPSDEAVASALPHVGRGLVSVDDSDPDHPLVTLTDPDARIDLGGIAKGYVADRLCQIIQDDTDASAAAISLGGNIAYAGRKPDGSLWDTGIRDPNDPGGSSIVGTAHMQGGSLVTSGLYERTFELDGVTYWHLLDPATGMPVITDTVSVTVCCPSSTEADALSTALFVAGSERGREMVEGFDGTAAYFILQDGTTVQSSRWEEMTSFEADS